MFQVSLQGNFDIDHSWEWKGFNFAGISRIWGGWHGGVLCIWHFRWSFLRRHGNRNSALIRDNISYSVPALFSLCKIILCYEKCIGKHRGNDSMTHTNFERVKVDESAWEWMRAHESAWERMRVDERAWVDENAREGMRARESGWESIRVDERAWEWMRAHESGWESTRGNEST